MMFKNILYFGGFDIEIQDTPLNNDTWDSSLATNQSGMYSDTINLNNIICSFLFKFSLIIN